MPFDHVQALQQFIGLESGGDYRSRVRIFSMRRTNGPGIDDPRLREKIDVLHLKRIDGLNQYGSRLPRQRVRLVGTQSDEIEMLVQISSTSRP